jgi:hypothetical protein
VRGEKAGRIPERSGRELRQCISVIRGFFLYGGEALGPAGLNQQSAIADHQSMNFALQYLYR